MAVKGRSKSALDCLPNLIPVIVLASFVLGFLFGALFVLVVLSPGPLGSRAQQQETTQQPETVQKQETTQHQGTENNTFFPLVAPKQDHDSYAMSETATSAMSTAVAKYNYHFSNGAMDGTYDRRFPQNDEGFPQNAEGFCEVAKEDKELINKELDRMLLHAARLGKWQRIWSLLMQGASIEAVGIYSNTPLMLAAIYGHPEAVQVLIDYGAAVDARNSCNSSPLILAAMNGHALITQRLVHAGADMRVKGCRGKTALEWAIENGYFDIYCMLRDADAARTQEEQQGRFGWWHSFLPASLRFA